ncbi:hypothetical protein AN958_01693 [Leucoagaricus sp. SymC.cos]|nr:hypothetical protein AN958_01693 [Leucoagaricus sp. SymC.cos]
MTQPQPQPQNLNPHNQYRALLSSLMALTMTMMTGVPPVWPGPSLSGASQPMPYGPYIWHLQAPYQMLELQLVFFYPFLAPYPPPLLSKPIAQQPTMLQPSSLRSKGKRHATEQDILQEQHDEQHSHLAAQLHEVGLSDHLIDSVNPYNESTAQILDKLVEIIHHHDSQIAIFTLYGAFWISYATSLLVLCVNTSNTEYPQERDAIGLYLIIWFIITCFFFIIILYANITFILLTFFWSLSYLMLSISYWSSSHAQRYVLIFPLILLFGTYMLFH